MWPAGGGRSAKGFGPTLSPMSVHQGREKNPSYLTALHKRRAGVAPNNPLFSENKTLDASFLRCDAYQVWMVASHSETFTHRCITLPWVSLTPGQDEELKLVTGIPLSSRDMDELEQGCP